MTEIAYRDASLKWTVFMAKRQGLTRDLPPGKEQWMWVPTSATLIYGNRDAVLVDAMLNLDGFRNTNRRQRVSPVTGCRSEVNSNCRFRFLNSPTTAGGLVRRHFDEPQQVLHAQDALRRRWGLSFASLGVEDSDS